MSHAASGIAELRAAYASGKETPISVIAKIQAELDRDPDDPTWINLADRETLRVAAAASGSVPTKERPLAGVPFAIKDNIDLAGLPTTAACPAFAYTPDVSAFVVQKLVDAGAIPIGKTNLDQFATGLVGVRSTYGVPLNPFNPDFIPGGSSSGSAVAVARGLCSFSLGTDTAGSGRVPAAFNELVGLKPTRGLLSTRGVVPACRTLDCVSVFTRTVADAATVFDVVKGYDKDDPFSRRGPSSTPTVPWPPRLGIPQAGQLEFFGDEDAKSLFLHAVDRWRSLGAKIVEIDFAAFREAARLLYEGPWVAERYAAIKSLIEKNPTVLHPVTRQVIDAARSRTAVEAFEARYQLASLRRRSEAVLAEVDGLLLPTTGTAYKTVDVLANPIQLNSNLGYYTNFVNLLDLCALALPAGRLPSGVPWGITLMAPAFCDDTLLAWGAKFLGEIINVKSSDNVARSDFVKVAVCGAHLSGLPLNKQLTDRGARLNVATKSAPEYRFFALPNTSPPKPGMVRVAEGGSAIDLEVWEMPVAHYGSFVAGIPAPLGIGQITLADGSQVHGFVCESAATQGAEDISGFGGWRAYLAWLSSKR